VGIKKQPVSEGRDCPGDFIPDKCATHKENVAANEPGLGPLCLISVSHIFKQVIPSPFHELGGTGLLAAGLSMAVHGAQIRKQTPPPCHKYVTESA
jgi:hypothetical protein